MDERQPIYIYTPAEETIDILRIDDSIRVITKSNIPTFSISKEPGLGYGNIRNRRSMDTNFHFWLVSRGHKHFSLDLGLLLTPLELLTARSCRVCTAKLRPGSICRVIGRSFMGPCRVSYPMIPILTVGFSKRYSGTTVGTCGSGKETPHILLCSIGIETL